MTHKYVNFEDVGFVVWRRTHDLWHSHVGKFVQSRCGDNIISAGFVGFGDNGVPVCYGMSESLDVVSQPGDSEALAKQLGIKTAPTVHEAPTE
jgi:hypothetical protein